MNVENPLLFMMALWTIFTVGEMVADKGFVRPTTWWQRNAWWMRWLLWGIGMAIAVALTVFSFGAGGFLIAAVAATTGLVIGGVVGGRGSGGWCWDTAKQGASLGVMVATAIMSVVGGIAGSVGKLGAKKVNGTVKKSIKVTNKRIKKALKGTKLKTQQGRISKPRVQKYVDMLLDGSEAPAILVDNGIIVDGNHRFIAGRIVGIEPSQIPWAGGSPNNVVPWRNVIFDSLFW